MSRILSAVAKSPLVLASSRSERSESISISESTVSLERPRTASSSDTVVSAIDACSECPLSSAAFPELIVSKIINHIHLLAIENYLNAEH